MFRNSRVSEDAVDVLYAANVVNDTRIVYEFESEYDSKRLKIAEVSTGESVDWEQKCIVTFDIHISSFDCSAWWSLETVK
jgi:hypothetical protein